ncbi:hypothetical protein [Shewanella japonica]|uniref:hypothetical protein n=1 Tax=Shewanella japonica TaxID=93973 RepID=UPI0024943EEF|nr:hypothetical protein [Shewanella japonica]
MKKVIIHIGSGKTGSTAIQKSLYKSKKVNDNIISFPTILNQKSNQTFRFAFCGLENTTSNVKLEYLDNSEGFKKYQQEIKNSLIKSIGDSQNIIISSEFLFLCRKSEVENIKLFFKSIGFEEVHVVVYLRDPVKYYLSVSQQSLKSQCVIPSPDRFNYDVLKAIEAWSSIEPTSFTVREFDRSKLFEGDVVRDFEHYLQSKNYNVKISKSEVENESMSVEGAVLLQEYQRLITLSNLSVEKLKFHKRKARLFSFVATEGTKPKLKPEIEDYIYCKWKSVISGLNKEFNIFPELIKDIENKPSKELDLPTNLAFTDIVTDFDLDSYLKLKNKLK